MRSMLAEAIDELDEKERHVLGLYYQEELTMKEVGLILMLANRAFRRLTAAIFTCA